MEGDAGSSSRLNPTDADDALGTKAEDSAESDAGAQTTNPEATTDVSAESDDGGEETAAEDADGADDADDAESEVEAVEAAEAGAQDAPVHRRPSRVGLGWLAGVAAALVVFAAGMGVGGYFLIRAHHQSQDMTRNNAAAIKAAIECVSATQAPDTSAMVASEQKIIDCGTDEFRSQALLYTSMLVQAYQASNVHVQVSDSRAAVERDNDDGSVVILVALRIKVTNDQQHNETGYRLRVRMSPVDGQYKISKLDQVTK
jgi:Mce-associated membrane protein